MAMLTIAGTDYTVVSMEERESEVVGVVARMFGGTFRIDGSTKAVYDATLLDMSEAAYQGLKADVGPGDPVTVTGDALPSAITAEVKITRAEYIRVGTGFERVPHITIRQE